MISLLFLFISKDGFDGHPDLSIPRSAVDILSNSFFFLVDSVNAFSVLIFNVRSLSRVLNGEMVDAYEPAE